jgi:predicted esterase
MTKKRKIIVCLAFVVLLFFAFFIFQKNIFINDGNFYKNKKRNIPIDEINKVWENREINFTYKNLSSKVFINKPAGNSFDILILFHGTTNSNSKSVIAAKSFIKTGIDIVGENNFMIVSLAYKEENVLIGEEVEEGRILIEWVKNQMLQDLGVKSEKVFLLGHSKGGYMALKLNNLIKTNGVIASAPGPIDLKKRCELEEQVISDASNKKSKTCFLMRNKYGGVEKNADEYLNRSLLGNLNNQQSRILIIQGEEDKELQKSLLDDLIKELSNNNSDFNYLKLENTGHWVFENDSALDAIRNFLKLN